MPTFPPTSLLSDAILSNNPVYFTETAFYACPQYHRLDESTNAASTFSNAFVTATCHEGSGNIDVDNGATDAACIDGEHKKQIDADAETNSFVYYFR